MHAPAVEPTTESSTHTRQQEPPARQLSGPRRSAHNPQPQRRRALAFVLVVVCFIFHRHRPARLCGCVRETACWVIVRWKKCRGPLSHPLYRLRHAELPLDLRRLLALQSWRYVLFLFVLGRVGGGGGGGVGGKAG